MSVVLPSQSQHSKSRIPILVLPPAYVLLVARELLTDSPGNGRLWAKSYIPTKAYPLVRRSQKRSALGYRASTTISKPRSLTGDGL
jgi:hypothetical protein